MENEFQEKLIIELEKHGYTKYIFRGKFDGVMVKNDYTTFDTKLNIQTLFDVIYQRGCRRRCEKSKVTIK